MTYPFEFRELLLTERILDKLEFSEYHSSCGEFGSRWFGIKISEHQFQTPVYRLWEIDEKDDDCDGYCKDANYVARYWCSENFSTALYFLHDLYEDIKANTPELLPLLEKRAKKINMLPYIESYLSRKEKTVLKYS
jgi:hypothetical protein